MKNLLMAFLCLMVSNVWGQNNSILFQTNKTSVSKVFITVYNNSEKDIDTESLISTSNQKFLNEIKASIIILDNAPETIMKSGRIPIFSLIINSSNYSQVQSVLSKIIGIHENEIHEISN